MSQQTKGMYFSCVASAAHFLICAYLLVLKLLRGGKMNKTINIAICDDEQLYVDKIKSYVTDSSQKYGIKSNIFTVNSGEMLLSVCEEKGVDAVFLDIALPGINGFETADRLFKIKKDIILIFVSSQEAMVYSAYEYKPFWFVPKSQIDMLEKVVGKLFKSVIQSRSIQTIIKLQAEEKKMIEINLDLVLYIKAQEHYVNVCTKDNSTIQSYRNKLDNIENQLKNHGFIRVHNRYLVNCRMISVIEKNCCVLLNGEEIPVSRARMADAKIGFQRYLRGVL